MELALGRNHDLRVILLTFNREFISVYKKTAGLKRLSRFLLLIF